MGHEYAGGKQPTRIIYITVSRFKGCQSIKGKGRGRRPSVVVAIERIGRPATENLSFSQKDAAVMSQALALTLRDAGYRGKRLAFQSDAPAPEPARAALPEMSRVRRSRRLTLDSFINPGREVSQRGGPETLKDPEEVEPEVVEFVQANLQRILRPLQDARAPHELVEQVREQLFSLSAILVKAVRDADSAVTEQ